MAILNKIKTECNCIYSENDCINKYKKKTFKQVADIISKDDQKYEIYLKTFKNRKNIDQDKINNINDFLEYYEKTYKTTNNNVVNKEINKNSNNYEKTKVIFENLLMSELSNINNTEEYENIEEDNFNTNKLVNNIFNSDNTHYLTLIGSLGTFGTYIYLLENNKNIKYHYTILYVTYLPAVSLSLIILKT